MSKRLEAAVKAWDHHWGDRYGDEALEEMGEEVQVALDASDAVLFSEEAVERAAATMHFLSRPDQPPWESLTPIAKASWREAALAVIDNLKRDDDV